MNSEEDCAFYERRLTEERARAAEAKDNKLKNLHLQWASLYEARLAQAAADSETAARTASRSGELLAAFDQQVRQIP